MSDTMLLMFFIGGVLLGYFLQTRYRSDEMGMLIIKVMNTSVYESRSGGRFLESMLKNGFLPVFAWLMSLCPPLGILSPLVTAYHGVGFGFSSGVLMKAYAGAGWIAVLKLTPQTGLVLLALLAVSGKATAESVNRIVRGKSSFKISTGYTIISILLVILATAAETLLF